MTSTTISTDNNLSEIVSKNRSMKLHNQPSFTIVDCDLAVSNLIDTLAGLPVSPPSIYIDLEGVNLSRQGTISIVQIYVLPDDCAYLLDVQKLQHSAFSITGVHSAKCLKEILEASDIPKVFFDVRNDSDALFHHFQISLAGVEDVQLMELATRTFPRRYVCGLQKCIEHDAGMTITEKAAWISAKEKGMELFLPDKGGRYEVFNERPLSEAIIQYCVQDVQFLSRLWSHYKGKMSAHWAIKVQAATEERVSLSQSKHYNGHGKHKAMAPRGWYTNPPSSARRNRTWGMSHDDY